jgi:hypothetical protein
VTETLAQIVPLVPAELRRSLLDFEWDPERLRALDLPVELVPVAELAWWLDLPVWRQDVRPFRIRPSDVLAEPERFRDQYRRTLEADLRYPLDITRWHGRWTIMDGVHRLAKAVLCEWEVVRVRKVPASAFDRIAVAWATAQPLR